MNSRDSSNSTALSASARRGDVAWPMLWRRARLPWPLVVAALLVVMVNLRAQPPTAQPGDLFTWNYSDDDLAKWQVIGFDVCIDLSSCKRVAVADARMATTSASLPGVSSYRYVLPTTLTPTTHSITVAACNTQVCGPTTAPLPFTWSPGTPTVPLNPQIVRKSGA